MKNALTAMLLLIGAGAFAGQAPSPPPSFREPLEPLRILGNIYYVGTAELGSFLITTPEGHILLDTPLESETGLVLDSIRKLGFDPKDIRILLNSQAHYDHTGGLAAIRRLSGARLMAGRGDVEILARGGLGDFAFGDRYPFPAVRVDRPLDDGDEIELGGVEILVRLTPGHTRGTTSYVMETREGERSLTVLFAGSLSINPGVRLANPPSYEGIAEDFARSVDVLKSIEPDVLLSAHGELYGLRAKAERLRSGAPTNPFLDAEDYRPWLTRMRKAYEAQLARDRETSQRN
jgi:metallo-beta-lactamase class B